MEKIWQFIRGPLAAGAPSHGTTGTMVNPAPSLTTLHRNKITITATTLALWLQKQITAIRHKC